MSSIPPSRTATPIAKDNGLGALLNLLLDRLEEWLIATLIGAATVVTFVAVVHRYGASNSAGLARWAGVHGFVLLRQAADWPYTVLAGGDGPVPLLAGRVPVDGAAAAYVCRHFTCQLPVTSAEELTKLLQN